MMFKCPHCNEKRWTTGKLQRHMDSAHSTGPGSRAVSEPVTPAVAASGPAVGDWNFDGIPDVLEGGTGYAPMNTDDTVVDHDEPEFVETVNPTADPQPEQISESVPAPVEEETKDPGYDTNYTPYEPDYSSSSDSSSSDSSYDSGSSDSSSSDSSSDNNY